MNTFAASTLVLPMPRVTRVLVAITALSTWGISLAACSSDDPVAPGAGGTGAGSPGTGGETGTGAAPGTGGETGTGGTPGTGGGPSKGSCKGACAERAAAQCKSEPAQSACEQGCDAIDEAFPFCAAESETFGACEAANGDKFTCNGSNRATLPDEVCKAEGYKQYGCLCLGPTANAPDFSASCAAYCAVDAKTPCPAADCEATCKRNTAAGEPLAPVYGPFFECASKLTPADFECNADGNAVTKDGICPFEGDLLVGCAIVLSFCSCNDPADSPCSADCSANFCDEKPATAACKTCMKDKCFLPTP